MCYSHDVEFINHDWVYDPMFLDRFPQDTDDLMFLGNKIGDYYELIPASVCPDLINLACQQQSKNADFNLLEGVSPEYEECKVISGIGRLERVGVVSAVAGVGNLKLPVDVSSALMEVPMCENELCMLYRVPHGADISVVNRYRGISGKMFRNRRGDLVVPVIKNTDITREDFISRYLSDDTVSEYYDLIYSSTE